MKLGSIAGFLIAAMVAALISALNAEKSIGSELEAQLFIGGQFNATEARAGGASLIYNNKLDLTVEFIGEGDNKWGGRSKTARIVSINRIITTQWYNERVFLGIGYANVSRSELVGRDNFRLLLGWQDVWGRVYLAHVSDFGIGNNKNTGLDGVRLGLNLSF